MGGWLFSWLRPEQQQQHQRTTSEMHQVVRLCNILYKTQPLDRLVVRWMAGLAMEQLIYRAGAIWNSGGLVSLQPQCHLNAHFVATRVYV